MTIGYVVLLSLCYVAKDSKGYNYVYERTKKHYLSNYHVLHYPFIKNCKRGLYTIPRNGITYKQTYGCYSVIISYTICMEITLSLFFFT